MFLPYVVRKAFQTVVLVWAVLILASGCGGGDDEAKAPAMPPVVTPPDGDRDGMDVKPLLKQSLFLPETELERLVYTFRTAHDDRRGFAERYFGPHGSEDIHYQRLGAVAQGSVVSSANVSSGYRAGDGHLVDARLSEDGSLSVFLERTRLEHVDGEDLSFPLGTFPSSQSGAVRRWDARGTHRADGMGRWRLKGAGWQSATDYGDWAVMGFYLVDEGVRDSNDRGIQVGTFALSPAFRKGPLYENPLSAGMLPPEEDVRYEGPTQGLMVDTYGTGRSHAAGTVAEAAYTGRATIDVTMDHHGHTLGTIARVKSILIDGLATHGEGRLTLPDGRRLALPSRTAIPTTYTGRRSSSGPLAGLVDPIGFSVDLDSNYHPRFLGGSYSTEDHRADGSVTYLLGSYLAATEASGLRDDLNALVGN